jgi:hypothetical protein
MHTAHNIDVYINITRYKYSFSTYSKEKINKREGSLCQIQVELKTNYFIDFCFMFLHDCIDQIRLQYLL